MQPLLHKAGLGLFYSRALYLQGEKGIESALRQRMTARFRVRLAALLVWFCEPQTP